MTSSASEETSKLSGDTAGETPLCINCKWYRRSWFPIFWDPHDLAQCRRPADNPRLTDRKDIVISKYAEIERRYDLGKNCGPSGRYFEDKS